MLAGNEGYSNKEHTLSLATVVQVRCVHQGGLGSSFLSLRVITVLLLQLSLGQVVHNASSIGITDDIDRGPDTITEQKYRG